VIGIHGADRVAVLGEVELDGGQGIAGFEGADFGLADSVKFLEGQGCSVRSRTARSAERRVMRLRESSAKDTAGPSISGARKEAFIITRLKITRNERDNCAVAGHAQKDRKNKPRKTATSMLDCTFTTRAFPYINTISARAVTDPLTVAAAIIGPENPSD
jgi:hypothetical protein